MAAALLLAGGLAMTPAQASGECEPGDDGCMPTPEQCASGEYTGVWDGGAPGRAAVCVGAEGHTVAYAGGTALSLPPCGHIMVADQTVVASEDDPNDCSPPTVERVRLPMHDGIELDAAIWRPAVADGVRVPVVVHALPYAGDVWIVPPSSAGPRPPVEDPFWLDLYQLDHLVGEGYAVANVSVRGTGRSGGCFELGGANEQQDMGTLVELLAQQPWSNGRVAMYGLSYMGTTPWFAAIQGVEALKTIIVAGTVTDEYTVSFSPQGAARGSAVLTESVLAARLGTPLSAVRPDTLTDPRFVDYAAGFAERACPEVLRATTAVPTGTMADDRDAEYYDMRRTIDRYGDVTAAVLLVHGFGDNVGHLTQDDHVWHTLTQAPQRMLLGQWGHEFPGEEHLSAYPHGDSWREILTEWLDHWLKQPSRPDRAPEHAPVPPHLPRLGPPPHAKPIDRAPREGMVDYQKPDGTWASSTSWPPAEARDEALYLHAEGLQGEPGTSGASFTSVTGPIGHGQPEFREAVPSSYCEPEAATAGLVPTGSRHVTDPVGEPVLVAGNPFALLSVETSQPGGIVSLDLYDVSPQAACSATGVASGVTWLSGGAADLRFHQGSFTGRDFPVGTATPVRVDLSNLAWTLEPGHRLALVATGPGFHGRVGQPYQPVITLHGDGTAAASHVVVPVVEGTLGGAATSLQYPPRPFLP